MIRHRLLRSAVVIPRAEVAETDVTEHYVVPRAGGPRAILLDRNGEALLISHPLRELSDVEVLAQVVPAVTHVPAQAGGCGAGR